MSYGNTAKDGSGTAYWLLQDSEGRLIIKDPWAPSIQQDTGADDSDKSFTVPVSTEWIVKWIWVELTTTGTAGNRQLTIEIQDDAADVIAVLKAGATQAASLTRNYLFAPNVTELTAFRDTSYLSTIMPEWWLPAGYVVRVYDSAAVDAAADDMIVHMMVVARTA